MSASTLPPQDVPAEQLSFDMLAPFPALTAMRAAAQRRDWPAVAAGYAALDRWDLRTAAVRCVAEVDGVEPLLKEVVATEGPDSTAAVMLAACHVEIGWGVRSGRRAQHVSRDQFTVFHEYLRLAEGRLIDITARDPGNLAAWTTRLMTARGLELGQSEARRRYDRCAQREPHHLAAQTQLLQQLCPKWSGSFEQVHEFARERAFASPPGSLNAVLVADGHLEHGMELKGTERDDYLCQASVLEEVVRAAEHSVLNPAFRDDYNWVTAHGYFALFHSAIANWPAAAVHFRAMGGYGTELPWRYFYGQPREAFVRHRTEALAKG